MGALHFMSVSWKLRRLKEKKPNNIEHYTVVGILHTQVQSMTASSYII